MANCVQMNADVADFLSSRSNSTLVSRSHNVIRDTHKRRPVSIIIEHLCRHILQFPDGNVSLWLTDLKPDNVMIVSDPEAPGGERAKILDFGIAKLASQSKNGEAVASQTSTGMMVGTPLYMSPEQCKGSGVITDKADVYSLGVMLYRMLAGRPPFLADGSGAIMAMHIYEKPTFIKELDPSVPDELANLIHALLAKDAQERPPMAQVVQALEQLRSIHSGAVGPITQGQTPIPYVSGGVGGQTGLIPGIGQSQVGAIARSQVGMVGQSQVGMVGQSQVGAPAPGSSHPGLSNSAATTLGQSAAQVGPQKGRGALWAGLLVFGLVLAAAGVFGTRALQKPVVTTPVAKMVRFSVDSEPSGAKVIRAADKQELGKTPWTLSQLAASGHLIVILRLDGYADKVVSIDQSENANHSETLKSMGQTATTESIPVVSTPVPPPISGKKTGKGKKHGGSATGAVATTQSAGDSSPSHPTPTPTPTPTPSQPSKEPAKHGRIQMVD